MKKQNFKQQVNSLKQKGFTLIEAMIVVVILAILIALAVPAYQDYSTRAKVADGMALAAGAKTAVSETAASLGITTTSGLTAISDNAAAGLDSTAANYNDEYVTSLAVANGVISITYTPGTTGLGSAGNVLTFNPTFNSAGNLVWQCGGTGTTIANKYLPENCR